MTVLGKAYAIATRYAFGLLLLAPTLVLAIWGYAYVGELSNYLAGPGVALTLTLKGERGNLTIRAKSASFNVTQLVMFADGVTVIGPNGQLIASVDRAFLLAPLAAWNGLHAAKVRLVGLRATLQVQPDGKLPLLDLLPKPKTDEPSIPSEIEVESATIQLVNSERPERHLEVQLDSLLIATEGSKGILKGSMQMPGGGDVDFEANYDGSGNADVALEAHRAAIAQLDPFLESLDKVALLKSLQQVSATSAFVSGKVRAWFRRDQPVRLLATLTGQAEGIVLPQSTKIDHATFDGGLTESGAAGVVVASMGRVAANFQGLVDWTGPIKLSGQVIASAPNVLSLPKMARDLVPKDVDFTGGVYTGAVSFEDAKGFTLDGVATSNRVKAFGEVAESVHAVVALRGDNGSLKLTKAKWEGGIVSGGVKFDFSKKAIALDGVAEWSGVRIGPLVERLGIKPDETLSLSGLSSGALKLTGTSDMPKVIGVATGSLTMRSTVLTEPLVGKWRLDATYADGKLAADHVRWVGPFGELVASGGWEPTKPTHSKDPPLWNQALRGWTASFDLRAMPVRFLRPDQSGVVFAKGAINGLAQNPTVSGFAQLYAARFGEFSIPVTSANFEASGSTVLLEDLKSITEGGALTGNLAMSIADGKLDGLLTAKDWSLGALSKGSVFGRLNVKDAVLSGTLEDPLLRATVHADRVMASDWVATTIVAETRYAKGLVHLDALDAVTTGGNVHATGTYDPVLGSGDAQIGLKGINVADAMPPAWRKYSLDGSLDADFSAHIEDNQFATGFGSGKIQSVRVEGRTLGNASFNLKGAASDWSARADLRGPNGESISADIYNFSSENKTILAALEANKVPLEAIRESILIPILGSDQVRWDKFQGVSALVSAKASVEGVLGDPEVDVTMLQVDDLALDAANAGIVTGSLQRAPGGKWTVKQLAWNREAPAVMARVFGSSEVPGSMILTGSFQEGGSVDLDGEVNNFSIAWLAQHFPALSRYGGTIDVPFRIGGQLDDPAVRASVNLRNIIAPLGDEAPDPFDVNFAEFEVANGRVSVRDGSFIYHGIHGKIQQLSMPAEWPVDLRSADLDAQVSLSVPKLADLKSLVPWIQPSVTSGSMDLNLHAASVGGKWSVTGAGKLDTARIANMENSIDFRSLKSDLVISTDPNGRIQAELQTSGTAPSLGSGGLKATIGFPSTAAIKVIEGDVEWKTIPIDGLIQLQTAAINWNGGPKGSVRLQTSGEVPVSGTAGQPELSGRLIVANPKIVLPTEYPESQERPTPPINPVFDLEIVTLGTMNIKSSTFDVNMTGGGKLSKTLSSPSIKSQFDVVNGIVQVPGLRLTLAKNEGTVSLLYDPNNAAGRESQLIAQDVRATTNLSAQRADGLVQRYSVEILLNGDLLSTEDWTNLIETRSTPGDLSKSQILNIFAQRDFFESLRGPKAQGDNRLLTDALTRFALPQFLDPIMDQLARQLGIDYIGFDYNFTDRASVTVAKTLGRNFTLNYRRQLTQVPGFKPKFDLRLTYRPSTRNRILSNFSLSIGIDQDRPWKISLEFSRRL